MARPATFSACVAAWTWLRIPAARMTASKPVGMVGLGLMGSALTERLISAGLGVAGFDVDAEKQRAWGRLGGSGAASLEEVAGLCDSIFLAVFDTAQVEQVVESGLL